MTYPAPLNILGLALVESGAKLDTNSFDNSIHTNRARIAGQDPVHVKQLQNRLKDGWDTNQQLPIAILGPNNRPVLIDGHHRLDAWKNLGHTTLPVNYYKLTGICTLEDIIVDVSLKANDHLPQKTNSKKDVESAVISYFEDRGETPQKHEIYLRLGELQLKNFTRAQFESMANNIYKKTTSSKQILTLEKQSVEKSVSNNVDVFGSIDKVLPCTSGSKYDYANRAIKECAEFTLKTGRPAKSVIYSLACEDAQDVYDSRRIGVEKMKEVFDTIRAVVKKLGDNEYPFEVVSAYPQVRGNEVIEGQISPVPVNFKH